MDQIANRNVAPSSAPAENHTFVQEMVADMHFNVETPPSDVKDPGKPTTSIEINLLIASENNNKENQITENLGKKSTKSNDSVLEHSTVYTGKESNFPGQMENSHQETSLGTSRMIPKPEFIISDEEEDREFEENHEFKSKKGATPAQYEENYGLPATIVADMKDYLNTLKPMKFLKNDNAATRLIQKFRKSLVCPKCGSLHGHTSQGTTSNQYGGTAPFKCRSSVPQLLMMLPHEVICAVGKVHREFCIKDSQLFAAWISSSKAEQKDLILKRLKQEMEIDQFEGPSHEIENLDDSQVFEMSQEEQKYKDTNRNSVKSADVTNYSDAEFRAVVIEELLSLRKRLSELIDENKALRQENAVLKKYRLNQFDISSAKLPNNSTSLASAVTYSEIAKIHTPRPVTIKRSRREVGPNVESTTKPRTIVDLTVFTATESDKNQQKSQETSKLTFVYFKGLIRRPQSEYRALLDQIGFGGYKARDILFLSKDFLQVLTYENCSAELVEKITKNFPAAKHVEDADPTDPINYEEHGNLSRKFLEAQYFTTMEGAVQRFKKLSAERPVLTRTLHFLEKVVETKNFKYEKAPSKPKIFLMNNFLVLQDLQDPMPPLSALITTPLPLDMETDPISVEAEVLAQVPMETSL